jgi:hypothetical protein
MWWQQWLRGLVTDVQIMRYCQPGTLNLLSMGNHRQVAMSSTAFPVHLWL